MLCKSIFIKLLKIYFTEENSSAVQIFPNSVLTMSLYDDLGLDTKEIGGNDAMASAGTLIKARTLAWHFSGEGANLCIF